MAQGSLHIFSDFLVALGNGLIDLETAELRCALVSDAITAIPKTAADPRFGIGGTTNLSTNEVSGTNYTAGGNQCLNPSFTEAGDIATYDADDPAAWLQSASGPANIKSAILYINDANDYAVGAIDLTSDGGTTPISLIDGDITVALNASGIFRINN